MVRIKGSIIQGGIYGVIQWGGTCQEIWVCGAGGAKPLGGKPKPVTRKFPGFPPVNSHSAIIEAICDEYSSLKESPFWGYYVGIRGIRK
jgi:hypothetical protein